MYFKVPCLFLTVFTIFQVKHILGESELVDQVDIGKVSQLCDVIEPFENVLASCKTTELPENKLRTLRDMLSQDYSQYSLFQKRILENIRKELLMINNVLYISECSAVVTIFKQGKNMMDQLEKTLKKPTDTRWNSNNDCLDSIDTQKEKVSHTQTFYSIKLPSSVKGFVFRNTVLY